MADDLTMKRSTVYYLGAIVVVGAILLKLRNFLLASKAKESFAKNPFPNGSNLGGDRVIELKPGAITREFQWFSNNPPESERDYSKPFTFWNPPPGFKAVPIVSFFGGPQMYFFAVAEKSNGPNQQFYFLW